MAPKYVTAHPPPLDGEIDLKKTKKRQLQHPVFCHSDALG